MLIGYQVTLSSPSNFHFNIAIQDEASMQSRYVVTCKGKPNIHSTILRHINTVATKLSFPDLLVSFPRPIAALADIFRNSWALMAI